MTTLNEQRPFVCYPTNIMTLQDVILDTPVFRSNVERVQEQIEQFEKWLEALVRVLKPYIDSLSKLNTQTSQVCKQLSFQRLESLDSQMVGTVVHKLKDALENNLTAKTKLVRDLDETLLQPLQDLIKTDLKDFKDMRRTFEKTLDKYENHLLRYSNLSKQKEPSSLREDAFQMFDIQKSYLRATGTYFVQLISLKSTLEHTLVNCFSSTLGDHLDYLDQSLQAQNSARGMIPGWQQWLKESRAVCQFQLERIEKSTRSLEDAYIRQVRPHRSLKRYSTSNNDQLVAISNSSTFDSVSDEPISTANSATNDPKMASTASLTPSSSSTSSTCSLTFGDKLSSSSAKYIKQGYLFNRITVGKPARYSWVRRWFFLKDGWFGQYTVSTVNKIKGAMTLNDYIPIDSSCECRIFTDIDRRFCFEINASNSTFFLQAETEQEMQQWLWTIERAKEFYGRENSSNKVTVPHDQVIPRLLLSPKANISLQKSEGEKALELVSISVLPPALPPASTAAAINAKASTIPSDYLSNDLSTISAVSAVLLQEGNTPATNNSSPVNTNDKNRDTSQEDTVSLPSTQTPNSSDKPTNDETKQQAQQQESLSSSTRRQASSTSASAWSMPWLINALSSTGGEDDAALTNGWVLKSSNNNEPATMVVWPNKVELDIPQVTLQNYSEELLSSHRELRRHFARVPPKEIVLDAFTASLYRTSTGADDDHSKSSIGVKGRDSQHGSIMDTGKGYCGTVYMTQHRLWFYSCRMMTCVHAAVIPYHCIKTIRLEKVLSANSQGMLMYIETKPSPSTSFCFGLWLEAAELIAERIRVATENAKRTEKMDDQVLFDILRCTTISKLRSKTPTSHLTSISALNAAVTPLTVQAQSRVITEPQVTVGQTADDDTNSSNSASASASSSLSDNSGFSAAQASVERQRQTSSPAAGALTAAMEAANEAQVAQINKSRRASLKKKSSLNKSKPVTLPVEANGNKRLTVMPTPAGPVSCGCDDHLDKVEADLELPMNARELYEFLSGLSCWEQSNRTKGNSVPSPSVWQEGKSGTKERILNYTMPNPMSKAKEADVVETQEILKEDNGLCYVMMISTKTPTLPYADSFIPMIKLCITYNTPSTCRLVCSIGVKWLKSIMMKGMVNRAALKGMTETITSLIPIVEQASQQGKGESATDGQRKQQRRRDSLTKHDKSRLLQDGKSDGSESQWQQQGDTKQHGILAESNILTSGTLLSPRWIFIFIGVALLLLFNTTWFKRRSIPSSTMSSSSSSLSSPSMGNISWRAVHLTDLEPLVNGFDTDFDRHNSSAYGMFKDLRSDIGGWNYRWFNVRHRLIAAELTYTREQLAVLRYELLTAFKMLNGMEQRLLESEYWNWLLDQRSKCASTQQETFYDNQRRPEVTSTLCNEVIFELDRI